MPKPQMMKMAKPQSVPYRFISPDSEVGLAMYARLDDLIDRYHQEVRGARPRCSPASSLMTADDRAGYDLESQWRPPFLGTIWRVALSYGTAWIVVDLRRP